jgi:AraC-like DNA-binding protein
MPILALYDPTDDHYLAAHSDPAWLQSKLSQGLTPAQIAALAGVPEGKAKHWLYYHGLLADNFPVPDGVLRHDYPAWLRHYFIEEDLTTEVVAKIAGKSIPLIALNLGKHGITKDTASAENPAPYQDRTWLEALHSQGLTAAQIAEQAHVDPDTIHHWLTQHGLEGEQCEPLHKNGDWLKARYLDDDLSAIELSRRAGVSAPTITLELRKHGLKKRGKKD